MKKILAAVLAVLFILTGAVGCTRRTEQPARFRVVASFYPMYIMALNVTDGVQGVQVDNMAGQQAGCLEDYQLQSKDMKNLEQATVFVINGAGMENFMDKVTSRLPNLRVVDTGENITQIKDEEGTPNPHLWVAISNYMIQVQNMEKGIAAADPQNAEKYQKNTEAYVVRLEALRSKMHEELSGVEQRDIITFHEAFPYFAEEFGLHVAAVVNREPDSQPSARELAETIRLVESSKIRAVFAEPQYPKSAANIIAQESGAKVYTLDPGITGENNKDAYLNAMENNLTVLKQALK